MWPAVEKDHSQYGKLSWCRCEDREEKEANDKTCRCRKIAAGKNEKAIPSAH